MRWLYLLLLFVALGLVGAFPALVLAYFFSAGQATVAWQIYGLGALILGSWLPLKGLIDSRVKQQPLDIVFPKHINSLAVSFAFVAFLFLIPFLYVNTFSTFLISILAYWLGGLPLALIAAVILQTFRLYQGARREKEMGFTNTGFVHFQEMRFGDEMIIDIERQAPRPYESEMLILPPLLEDNQESFDNDGYYADDVSSDSSSDST